MQKVILGCFALGLVAVVFVLIKMNATVGSLDSPGRNPAMAIALSSPTEVSSIIEKIGTLGESSVKVYLAALRWDTWLILCYEMARISMVWFAVLDRPQAKIYGFALGGLCCLAGLLDFAENHLLRQLVGPNAVQPTVLWIVVISKFSAFGLSLLLSVCAVAWRFLRPE